MLDDDDKPLVLYGEGGCGKTSLLAKAASMSTAKDWFKNKRPISVIRFLGTTPDSSALTPTLISICQQVNLLIYMNLSCVHLLADPSSLIILIRNGKCNIMIPDNVVITIN